MHFVNIVGVNEIDKKELFTYHKNKKSYFKVINPSKNKSSI